MSLGATRENAKPFHLESASSARIGVVSSEPGLED